jgi:hypothetical protein
LSVNRIRHLVIAVLLTLGVGLLTAPPTQAAAPAEGSYVSYGGRVYRIAGGAPIYASATYLATLSTAPPINALTAAEWSALPTYPRNNTYIRTMPSKHVYVMAGGAPLYVSSTFWASIATKPTVINVDETTVAKASSTAPYNRIRKLPLSGPFLHAIQEGHPDHWKVFRVIGGAPVFVSTWSVYGGTQPLIKVGMDVIEKAGSGGLYNHLLYRPYEGTILRVPDGKKYRIVDGAPIPHTTTNAGILTDPDAIANAGKPGRYSHLAAPDTTPPETSITAGPTGTVSNPTVSYAFSSSEANSSFQCSWDDAGWEACTSPASRTLSSGPHVFAVRAIDKVGNIDPTPQQRGVIITTTRSRVSVAVKAIKKRSRLRVNVGPDSATHNYRFVVQRKVNGKWKRVKKSRTKGSRDRKVLNLRRGVYRVKVPAQHGLKGKRSKRVKLRR